MTHDEFNYDGNNSILIDWERCDGSRLPPPPAVHSQQYRAFIVQLILEIARPPASFLSLGCGNGFVEVELKNAGFQVLATDSSKCAVMLTERKGVSASLLNILDPITTKPKRHSIIYADGLMGHLLPFEGRDNNFILNILNLIEPGGFLVLSNDLADGETTTTKVTSLPNARFTRAPRGYIAQTLHPFLPKFHLIRSEIYSFMRPGRGVRNREIIIFQAPFSAIGEQMESTSQ